MAKSLRGRHDDAENQSGGFPAGDEDAGIRSTDWGSPNEKSLAEASESSPANGGGAADAPTGAAGAGPPSDGAVATKGRSATQKAAAFSRLASIRASNAIDAMRGISHLANPKQYAFTRDQVDKMISALSDSVEALRKGFAVAIEQAEAQENTPAEPGRRKRGVRHNFSIRV